MANSFSFGRILEYQSFDCGQVGLLRAVGGRLAFPAQVVDFIYGQVNPFGMCFDEYFNIFTADCHSKPIYQLLRGGYYPSFGKPHDGLGFVPPMMDHLHGSTAICGLVKYSGENFPEEYRGDFYSGNVMTSRINRNKPEYHGSMIKAIEQPDFLTTTLFEFRGEASLSEADATRVAGPPEFRAVRRLPLLLRSGRVFQPARRMRSCPKLQPRPSNFCSPAPGFT